MKSNQAIIIGIFSALVLGLTGCGSTTYDSSAAVESEKAASFQDTYMENNYESVVAEESQESVRQVVSERKLIKTVDMSVETEQFKELTETLNDRVSALGGYVEKYSIEGEEGYRYSNMVIRVPQNQLDTFLEVVEGQSNITYKQERIEDVTLDYVDLESHKKMYQKEQERLLELLEQAETIEEIIQLEERLTEVRYQLESMESKLRVYDNKINYSTVYLDISEVERYTPQEQNTVWDQIKTGFSENLYRVGKGIKNFAVGFVIRIPIIVVWLIIIALFALVVKCSINVYEKRMTQKQADKQLKKQNEKNREENGKKMNDKHKSGFAALIGRPNVGKSTLMNCLIGQKIAITSNKPQTTRNRIQTVYTSQEGQIVFVDTPGIHKSKNKLGDYMVGIAQRSLKEVDVVLWLVEPTDYIGAGEQHIIEQLKQIKTPVILVINKIDTVKKEQLLQYIDVYRKQMDFAEIVPVSALKDDNTDTLIKLIMKYLPYGPAFYDEDTITDQPMRQIVAELVREKVLCCIDEEIPHGVAVTIESMKYSKKIVDIDATIICEKDSHKGIIIGKGGAMLKKIGTMARPEIEDLLEMHVNLQLWVKVKKDWRDSDFLIKNFGYNPKDVE